MDGYIFGIGVLIMILVASISMLLTNRSNAKRIRNDLDEQFGQIPEESDLELESIVQPWKQAAGKDLLSTIDDLTWSDLDMDKVFARLDSCRTSLGEEYLYAVLHKMADEQDIARREELMACLDKDPKLRLNLQSYLEKTGKSNYNGLTSFLNDAGNQGLAHPWIYRLLTVLPLICCVILPFNYMLAVICILAAFCANILVSYYARKAVEQQLPAMRYFSTVLWCCKKVCGTPGDGLSGFRKGLRDKLSALRGIQKASSRSTPATFFANDTQAFAEFGRMVLLQDIRSYNKLVRLVQAKKETCLSLCRELAELDAAIAILSFRKSLPFYSKPHFIKTMQMNLQDLYHPLLRDPIPNSVMLSGDALITGSNASGKSTFIKAAAVNGILAASINTCTARVYQAPRVLVITSMAVRDNLTAGESYFVAEIKSMKRVLDYAEQNPCLCFIDEILKGTNTVERIAASTAVLRFLHRQNCLCVAASHDMELTKILEEDYENYHFTEQITNREILFDYLIKPGPSKSKNAVRLLSFMNFDSSIIQGAESMVKQFEETGKWD